MTENVKIFSGSASDVEDKVNKFLFDRRREMVNVDTTFQAVDPNCIYVFVRYSTNG